jgi:hypothetical protein
VQQVDERHAPLLAEHALQLQPVDLAGDEQDVAQPFAGARLAVQGPPERLLVDEPGGEERLADRRRGGLVLDG